MGRLRLRSSRGRADDAGVKREIPVAAPRTSLQVTEVARLEVMRRLSMGAAHALNNAFTAVVGEASFLREEHKEEGEVTEACDTILRELDRCARLTRALLARRHPPQAGRDEVDLGRLVRDLGPLLRETLGRQKQLELELPGDLLLVRGEAGALELLVLLLLHQGADLAPGPARLRLALGATGGEALLALEVEADGLAEDAGLAFGDPQRAADPMTRNQLTALASLAASLGGSASGAREGPCHLVAAVRLPALGG
jgi:signal transduction histidine kinase